MILGDAAPDFVFLVAWRGWSFTEDVLRHYAHPLDDGFRDRLRFIARLLTPIWLGLAHDRGSGLEKVRRGLRNAYAPDLHGLHRAPKTRLATNNREPESD